MRSTPCRDLGRIRIKRFLEDTVTDSLGEFGHSQDIIDTQTKVGYYLD